jgi:hypothetical protein
MTLILINEPTDVSHTDATEDSLASHGLAPINLPVVLFSPDDLPAFEINDRAEPNQAALRPAIADPAMHALLFGRYVGQISARIERAWLRPRTPVADNAFACRVQIKQDRQGNVEETTLQRCNGDMRWQMSLVEAIQSASPLPAPPDPDVFANALILQFKSKGYVPGAAEEGFEPISQSRAGGAGADPDVSKLLLHFNAKRAKAPKSSNSVDLRIEGRQETITPSVGP